MKILYVTTISNTVNAFLIPHIKLLIDEGHQVDVAFNIKRDPSYNLIEFGCKIHNIEFQRSPFKIDNIKAYKQLKKLILNEGYDLIHTHTPLASFITRTVCKNMVDIKIIYTAHGFHFFKGAPLKNWFFYYPIEKLTARWTDVIITMNNEDFLAAQKFKMKMKDSVYMIHGVGIEVNSLSESNGNEREKLRKKYGLNTNEFVLFYAAELNYNKHQDLLIMAIKILKKEMSNIKLLLAGTGRLKKKYEDLIRKHNLQDNIELLGYRNDVPHLLKVADVVVASSRREGLPVNVLEAMAMGVPIIATKTRGHVDLICDKFNGYLVDKDNANDFAYAIKKLYNSKELRLKFIKNSYFKLKEYDQLNVLNELKYIYENILITSNDKKRNID
ncbi:glycosyltransferase family 1 protein [Virgibacillus dokdonensis]|uniref:Glycosyltransferase family 1 protein n=1 Tax=Virgibacillus dokdonensis TaxID=302167 RepID=A0A3E0WMU4_9BACI|nr:glycosyltransferase family 4 protein [Virgibacillus dokdonensis]RFA33377.1 glycosyltransferase family 1 protein [Virgibacillus dokdonensis]